MEIGSGAVKVQEAAEEPLFPSGQGPIGLPLVQEGRHEALGQWIGRTSQNRTLNFTHPDTGGASLLGQYMHVRVTRSGPNSLAGESVTNVV